MFRGVNEPVGSNADALWVAVAPGVDVTVWTERIVGWNGAVGIEAKDLSVQAL